MEGLCRGCLLLHSEPAELLQYTEKNRRLFIYATGLQVKRNDSITFQLCKECYFNMKQSCKFKKQCRTSDKKLKNYVKFKEDGFGSFKNTDENLCLRLPLISGHSTPAYQKNRDDDNDSTCTSIRNFMTDILDGEEMPPTEARIIREVIEEEADILDESLDSHWLQDNVSVASDFDIDFGISPFATPRSIQNDHSYTPKRIDDAKQLEINFLTSKDIIEKISKPKIAQKFDMPLLEDLSSDMELKNVKLEGIKTEKVDKNPIENSPDMLEFNNSIPSEVEDMVTENSISSKLECFNTDLLADLTVTKDMGHSSDSPFQFVDTSKPENSKGNIVSSTDENDMCIILNQGIAGKKAPITNDLDYYVNKVKLKKRIASTKVVGKEYHCTIDRNLDIALKHEDGEQFPLVQLITTPAVSIRSGASTPTINNLLFGDKDTTFKKSNTSTSMIENLLFGDKLDIGPAPKYFPQVGQSIDNLDDDCDTSSEDFNNDGTGVDKTAIFMEFEPHVTEKDTDTLIPESNNKGFKIDKQDLVKSDEHMEVLEEFLRGPDDPLNLNEEIIDQIIDPQELSDKELFKRPQTPPYDKYDLEKGFCKICNKGLNSSKALRIHFTKIHKYKLPNDDTHRNKTQNKKTYVCEICGLDIKGAANYSRHLKKHKDKLVGYFECDDCKLFFNSRMAVQVHIKKMHMKRKDKKKKFVCSTCGKVSETSSHNKLHQRRHLKQYSVRCEVCNKGFYSNHDLAAHMRFHSGERPFACQYCSKDYKRREQLNQHIRRHMGQLPFKCEVCQLGFVTKDYLARHYTTKGCIEKRKNASQKTTEKVTTKYGKGSLDTIRKMMLSANMEVESENEETVQSEVIKVDKINCDNINRVKGVTENEVIEELKE